MSLSSTNMINLFALSNLSAIGKAQNEMGSAIEKLSTGMGINHAKDNASAFSISEKMRSYINGLKKAALNAQDGTSYLQTAEGATEEVVSMLQRMRELAVQASNGTYTANDRIELQKEMDQLKQEIDRISDTAEFNTKKLLNGDSAGKWNSSTSKVGAVITGNVEEGNYAIAVDVEPGKNQVQKTNILALKEGATAAQIEDNGNVNVTSIRNLENIAPSENTNYTLTVQNAITAGDSARVTSSYLQDGSLYVTGDITNVTANASGYMIIEFTEPTDEAQNAGTNFRAKFYSAETGEEGAWVNFTTGVDNSLSATYTSSGFNISFEMEVPSVNSKVKTGDRLMLAFTDNKSMPANADILSSGGGTLILDMNGVTGPAITYNGVNSLTTPDNNDGVEDNKSITIHTLELDSKTGFISKGSLAFDFKETNPNNIGNGQTRSGIVSFEVRGTGEAATYNTKLKDIKNFVNSEGVDILNNTQELKIYGNGKQASIFLEGNDTVRDMKDKLTKAIVEDLEMGSHDAFINERLVQYLPTDDGSGTNAVRGTMIIQTALTGDVSQLAFIGDQSLIDAFGLAEIQKSQNNISTVTVNDSHTGVLKGELVTDSDRVRNLLKGVDITIDTRTAATATWNMATESIEFHKSTRLDNYNINLHIVDTRSEIQTGTSEGEVVDVSIPQLDTVALGIDNTFITSQSNAQNAITDIDAAIAKVNSVRSTIGAKINRLDSAYAYLQNARQNMTASESRIRDTDMAAESTNLASAQALSQAGLAMLAQANQIPAQALRLLQA